MFMSFPLPAGRRPPAGARLGTYRLAIASSALTLGLGALGCSGSIGDSSSSPAAGAKGGAPAAPGAPSSSPGATPATPATPGGAGADCRAPGPGPSPLRRLNRTEYANTVRDLLGDAPNLAADLPAEERAHGFDNNATTRSVSDLLAERYFTAAGLWPIWRWPGCPRCWRAIRSEKASPRASSASSARSPAGPGAGRSPPKSART